MLTSILISVSISVIAGLAIGIPYISGVNERASDNRSLQEKRAYVIANLQKFKVNNEGTSMDNNNIYLVEREKMGFKDV